MNNNILDGIMANAHLTSDIESPETGGDNQNAGDKQYTPEQTSAINAEASRLVKGGLGTETAGAVALKLFQEGQLTVESLSNDEKNSVDLIASGLKSL